MNKERLYCRAYVETLERDREELKRLKKQLEVAQGDTKRAVAAINLLYEKQPLMNLRDLRTAIVWTWRKVHEKT